MPRKVKYKSYSKNNVKIDRISFEMEESLGNWNSYPWIKFNYFYDYKGDARYCYFIALNNYVEGYFYAQDEISKESNEYINKYDRIMVLYDLAIDHRAYSRLGKLLINHLLYLSKINGLQALVIDKVDQCSFFINFIKVCFFIIDLIYDIPVITIHLSEIITNSKIDTICAIKIV